MIKGFCLFPELFSPKPTKFNRFAIWLSTNEAIICPNVRDIFTAGGQGAIIIENKTYNNTPKIFLRMLNNIEGIKECLQTFEDDELKRYWNVNAIGDDIFEKWVELVLIEAEGTCNLPLSEFLII